MTTQTTTLRLLRPFEADGRWVESVAFVGAPGSEKLPVNAVENGAEMDARAMAYTMGRRTGLTMAGIERMDAMDRMALALLLFAPAAFRREVSPPNQAKKNKNAH